jgi:3-oxoacyl-[acyl-carrier protein] reductase
MIQQPVALITGASRGLGHAMAFAFAKRGYAVVVNYRANEAEANRTVELVTAQGVPARAEQADVRDSAQVNKMVSSVMNAWARIDVLVNNAGAVKNGLISKLSDSDWRDVIAVNLDGAFHCTRAVIPHMREKRDGVILNVSSYTALRAVQGGANYAAAKAGLIALTKNTAIEEGGHNIRANAILPGYHVTDMNRETFQRFESRIREQHLLKDLPSREEMSKFVVDIAALKSVTGQVFAFESRIL